MDYRKPAKLLPLQLYAPYNSHSSNRLISRDEARLSLRSKSTKTNSLDFCVKSFNRLYYQPAIRMSSFHHSFITGKTRLPRQLQPLNKKKTETKFENSEKIKNKVQENEENLALKNTEKKESIEIEKEIKNIKTREELLKNIEKFSTENSKTEKKTSENRERAEEITEDNDFEKKEQVKIEEKNEEILKDNKNSIREKGEFKIRKLLVNGSGTARWQTDQKSLVLESMKITVEGLPGFLYVPLPNLKYILSSTKENIGRLIRKFLRADHEIRWFFYIENNKKKVDISSEYPYLFKNEPENQIPEFLEFEMNITRGPYSYFSGISRKVIVNLPKITFKSNNFEKTSLVSMNNLDQLLNQNSDFPEHLISSLFRPTE